MIVFKIQEVSPWIPSAQYIYIIRKYLPLIKVYVKVLDESLPLIKTLKKKVEHLVSQKHLVTSFSEDLKTLQPKIKCRCIIWKLMNHQFMYIYNYTKPTYSKTHISVWLL